MSVSINGAGSITGIDQGFNVTSGNIGIGTTSPETLLTVAAPGSSAQIELKRTNANATGAIGALNFTALDGHSVANIHALGDGNDEGADLVFKTTSAASENNPYGSGTIERMRIASDGQIFIGGSSDNSDSFSDAGTFLNLKNNTYGGRIGFSNNTATAGVSLMEQFAYWGNNKISGIVATAGSDTSNKDDGDLRFYTRQSGQAVTERFRIDSVGKILIGSGAIANPKVTTVGAIDTSNSDWAIVMGGSGSGNRANNAIKDGRFAGAHYTNAEEPIGLVRSYSTSSANEVHIGGGSSLINAATQLSFYTATNTTTTGGTERLHITSGGKVKMTSTTNNQRGLSVIAPKTQINFGISEDVGGFLMSENNGQFGLSGGGYWDGGNWIATNSGSAQIRHDGGGAMVFCTNTSLTSGNSFTPSERFRIGNTGNITFGNQSGGAETSSTIKHIDSGRDYWNGTAGDYRALRYRTYYTNTDDAYGMGVSASLLEFQSQSNMGFFTGSAGVASGRRVERMRIDSSGRVTMPYQPCFWATSNTGGTDTSEGYTGIISNQMEHAYVNIGNHFNTSNGIFYCPVAGTYEFHGQGLIRYQSGAGRAELTFYKNGSNTISRSYGYTYITGASDHDNLHVMAYITCAANDQIDLRVYAMDSGIDCYFAQGLGYFAGRLVQ